MGWAGEMEQAGNTPHSGWTHTCHMGGQRVPGSPGPHHMPPSQAWQSSACSGITASPSLIQSGPIASQHVAMGGEQLKPPLPARPCTYLQLSSLLMCFVNSFSLEGARRAAVKCYHRVHQGSSHP